VTDLRDQLADFEAAARRLLTLPARAPRLVLVNARPATCHPDRPLNARGLCDSCYETHWKRGTLDQFPTKRTQRSREHFVADYELLRSEGYTRRQIAERLGMTRDGVAQAYGRAVRAGLLTPDRRTA
jgi:CRP-like cAMP-binding protein